MARILDFLPGVYHALLPAAFHLEIPPESLCTCDDCAMCRRPGEPRAPGVRYFQPDARCCTFCPSLPNYLVGALLADASPTCEEGQQRVYRILEESEGAGPLALGLPARDEARYARLADRGFGRRHSLVCPYFRPGANDCTVWGYRNGVCATYFCRTVRGLHGAAFWQAVQRYLGILEKALAAYALRKQGWREDASRFPAASGADQKARVYRNAYETVAILGQRAVGRIGGEPLRSALAEVRAGRERMLAKRLPGRLRVNPGLRIRRRLGQVFLQVPGHITYCLDRKVWECLGSFNGTRDPGWVARELRRGRGLELTREFLLALYRAGILLPEGSPGLA